MFSLLFTLNKPLYKIQVSVDIDTKLPLLNNSLHTFSVYPIPYIHSVAIPFPTFSSYPIPYIHPVAIPFPTDIRWLSHSLHTFLTIKFNASATEIHCFIKQHGESRQAWVLTVLVNRLVLIFIALLGHRTHAILHCQLGEGDTETQHTTGFTLPSNRSAPSINSRSKFCAPSQLIPDQSYVRFTRPPGTVVWDDSHISQGAMGQSNSSGFTPGFYVSKSSCGETWADIWECHPQLPFKGKHPNQKPYNHIMSLHFTNPINNVNNGVLM